MNAWRVTWWDGINLRETMIPSCDPYNVVNFAIGHGINGYSIIKIERVPV